MIPENIDFEMRGGDHPNPEMNAIEKNLAEEAYARVLSSPVFSELGFKRTYNWLHCLRFYMSRDPYIIKLMYKLEPYPEYIEMEVTQVCPLKCIMCEHTYWDEKPDILTFDRFKYAMDQFPNLKWAGNNALGDPFTNPDYLRMCKYVDDRDVVSELYLTSTCLKEKDMKRFIDLKGLVWAKFSIDAATKQTYEKIRVNIDFDKVMANIKALDNYKKDAGRHFPEIQFHYIIMKENIHEVYDYLDMIDSLGINCTGVTYSRLLHNFPEIDHLFTEIPQDMQFKLVEKGKKLNIPVHFNADLPSSKPPAHECMAWSMPYIFPDGTVISCCCMNEQNRRWWQRQTKMGNIFEKPFREIWYDEPYRKLRYMLKNRKPLEAHPVCEICNIYDISCYKKGSN